MRTILPFALCLVILSAVCSAQTVQKPKPPAAIRTAVLNAKPIHIRVQDLPAPAPGQSARIGSRSISLPPNATLYAPKGFTVSLFAQKIPKARWLAFTPDGDLLCAASQRNVIYILRDTNHDGVADEIHTFLDEDHGANLPFGMAFDKQGHFYLGNTNAVLRYDYAPGQTSLTSKPVTIIKLPRGGHWTRDVRVSPDGKKLFVSVGSRSNVSVESTPRASVLEMNLDGTNVRTIASGLRNPVGLDFEPKTREIYTVVNERDLLGNELVPDYFTRLKRGQFYGWPYVYLRAQNVDHRINQKKQHAAAALIKTTVTPDVLFAAHSAPLGVAFYRGTAFPAPYNQGAFVAFHGSWNRKPATGYKVVFVPFKNGRPAGGYVDFVTGFLLNKHSATTWGRPTGVAVSPKGDLFFTDDMRGQIFRVSYSK